MTSRPWRTKLLAGPNFLLVRFRLRGLVPFACLLVCPSTCWLPWCGAVNVWWPQTDSSALPHHLTFALSRTLPEQQRRPRAGEQQRQGRTIARELYQAPKRGITGVSAMSGKYIIAGLAASAAIAYASDVLVAQKKVFGGTTPRTISDKEWWQATDKRFQAWPRTAGPPVVMNPISRQNFIVKDLKP